MVEGEEEERTMVAFRPSMVGQGGGEGGGRRRCWSGLELSWSAG